MTRNSEPRNRAGLRRTRSRGETRKSLGSGEATRLVSFLAGLLLVLAPFFGACPGGELLAAENGWAEPGEEVAEDAGAVDEQRGSSPANVLVADELAGEWVVHLRSAGARSLWGHGVAMVTSRAAGTLTLTAEMDDGASHLVAVEGMEDGLLVGYYALSVDDLLSRPEGYQDWHGVIARGGAEIHGERITAAGTERTVFHRAQPIDQSATGVWMSDDTSTTAVVGCDGESLLLTVVEGCRSWDDVTRQFDLEISSGSPLLTGNSAAGPLEALAFGQAGELHLHLRETASDGSIRSAVFLQGTEPAPLTGRWILGEVQYAGEMPRRGRAIAVEHDDSLFIYEAFDHAEGLSRGRCATLSGGEADDGRREWSGRIDETGHRIVGSYAGDDGWLSSLDRAVSPMPGELRGQWQSVSVDWHHHDSTGANVTAFGEATIVQNGDLLEITDVYDGGSVYRVEASWIGDHYEGVWYEASAPDVAWPWRGELSSSRAYLHGTWDQGEYSFSAFPMTSEGDFLEVDGPVMAISVDTFSDILMRGRDDSVPMAFSIERDQVRETAVNIVWGDATIRMELDERLRMTRLLVPGRDVSLDWAEEGSRVRVTITDLVSGAVIRRDQTFDFDPEAVVALSYGMDAASGITNLSFVRTWLTERDVDLDAIFSGEEAPPSVVALLNDPDVLRSLGQAGVSKDGFEDPELENDMLFFLAVVGGWALSAQIMGWITVGMSALALAALTALGAAVGVATVMVTVYFLERLERRFCAPCTLACFWSCEPPGVARE